MREPCLESRPECVWKRVIDRERSWLPLAAPETNLVRIACRRGFALLRGLLLGLAFTAPGLDLAAAADSAVRSVDVRSTGDGYVVDLVMWTPVARELAFDVLVDFERIANWSPSVRASRVVKREAKGVTVEYSGNVRLGAVTVPFVTVREVEVAAPAVIESTQVRGTMRRHRSRIDLAPEGAGTRLDYHLEMEPSAIVAALLTRSRIEQELRDTFEAAAEEMLRRRPAATAAAR